MSKIFKIVILIHLLVGFLFPLSAQIGHGGKPYSFRKNSSLQSLAIEKLPYFDNELLLQEEIASMRETGFQFGKEISVDYTLNNSGTWDTLSDGSRLWRLGIYSQEAYSLNLLFDSFYIPSSSNLFIYTEDKSFIMGSFTSENNNQWGNFATSLLPGNEIVLEYYESAKDKGKGVILLSTIVHGYKDFFFKRTTAGNSGRCNINVNCQEGDNFQEAKRAVALILNGGSALCSGTLLNNTAQDGEPFFLTANHCMKVNPSRFVFVFNYESIDCGNNDEKKPYSINGAKLLASHEHSDFALLRLNDKPQKECLPYYAGWDRRNMAIVGAAGIHHPKGDLKKISRTSKLLDSSKWEDNNPSFPDNTHWEVPSWDKGTTEDGSSGSALFNPLQQVIGQLEGGHAGCSGTQPNGAEDWYGKFSYSWTNGNSSDSNRLDYWLDPIGSGIEVLNGYDWHKDNDTYIANYEKQDNTITISPNPANAIVNIEANAEIVSCALYSVNGQCMGEYFVNSNRTEIAIHLFPSGIYLLKTQTANGLIYKKLIVQK